MTDPVERLAGRVLLLDDQDRVLLIRYVGEAGFVWWSTPGGALEPGETYEQAARREVWEETGLRDFELGPWIWYRDVVFPWRDTVYRQRERIYLARLPASFEPTATHLMDYENEVITEFRWFTLAELRQLTERVAPRNLPDHLEPILAGRLPPEPLDLTN